jgi:2'-deoxymugineic-acid 2'-dioxygenase/mugineic-acid 3-dioxygenase
MLINPYISTLIIIMLQVINHGISEQVMRDMEAVGEEFFGLPAMDKAEFYSESEDMNTVVSTRLYSSTTYETGGEKYWRDCLRLVCSLPVNDDSTKDWPHKPQRLR